MVTGTDGRSHAFEVHAAPAVTAQSSVLVMLPGAGGASKQSEVPLGKAPQPVWEVLLNVAGKNKVRTPSFLAALMQLLRDCTAEHRNPIFVVGFSRGAAWVVDLALEHAALFDAAIALAPYPWTRQPSDNTHEARQLMQVSVPLLLVHFAEDQFCNAVVYSHWFAQFSVAMESPPGDAYGQRKRTFGSFMVPGNHHRAWKAFQGLTFEELSPDICAWWRGLWAMSSRG